MTELCWLVEVYTSMEKHWVSFMTQWAPQKELGYAAVL